MRDTDDNRPFVLLFARPAEVRASDFDLTDALAVVRRSRPTGRCDQILILTTRGDDHADEVMIELMTRGAAVRRINLDAFPDRLKLTVEFPGRGSKRAWLESSSATIFLDEVRTVWMRRPVVSLFHTGALPDAGAVAARLDAEAAFQGVMSLLGSAFWVNSVASLWAAESKIGQLRVAASKGLAIPRTLVTTDPERAREFYQACGGRVVVKAFRGQMGSPWTRFQMVCTSRLLPHHLEQLDLLRHAPCIIQEEVPKVADIRITIIGARLFPVIIRSRSDSVDWKDKNAGAAYETITLPPKLEATCRELVRSWQLSSAAIDMILRPDGEYVFVEINAHHDWLWLQKITGLPMVEAMADLLESESGHVSSR